MGQVNIKGPSYGHYPNAVKTLLTVKTLKNNITRKVFNGTNFKISTGACHLGATVGREEFKEKCVKMKKKEMTGDGQVAKNWRDRTTRGICCIYAWLEAQVNLFIKDNF